MNVFGVLLALAGAILFLASLAITLRANTHGRIPFWTNPAHVPTGSIAMRSIGAGFLVFGAALLVTEGWWWTVPIMLVAPAISLVAIGMHNRMLDARSRA